MSLKNKDAKLDKEKEVRCADCGKRFKGNEETKCPFCGSTIKSNSPTNFFREVKVALGISVSVKAEHKAHMNPESFTILALILGFVIPPTFYAIFSILTISFWFKLLIWLGIILIAFCLTRSYYFIILLRFIADKAYGKHKYH